MQMCVYDDNQHKNLPLDPNFQPDPIQHNTSHPNPSQSHMLKAAMANLYIP